MIRCAGGWMLLECQPGQLQERGVKTVWTPDAEVCDPEHGEEYFSYLIIKTYQEL